MPDPRLGSLGWYGFFMASPVFVIALILLVPIVRNRAKGELQKVALAGVLALLVITIVNRVTRALREAA